MKEYYPLFFKPELKDYLWGGRKLEKYGRYLPPKENIAESWEISGHPDGLTLVENGVYAGKTLDDLIRLLGEGLVGTHNRWALERGKFPLLVKLIDAHQNLSVQVHPGDEYALAHEGNELGKTEMWVVLDAEPNAGIIYGLSKQTNRVELRAAIINGSLTEYLKKVPLNAGDHICVPSGTLHAILAGTFLVEVQQNSNTTYRAYDWGRVNQKGESRELHIEKSLDVINYDQVDMTLTASKIIDVHKGISVERLCQNQYFTTDRLILSKGTAYSGVCDGTTLEIWGLLSGEIEVNGQLMQGIKFVLLPAALGEYKIKSITDSTLLRIFVE